MFKLGDKLFISDCIKNMFQQIITINLIALPGGFFK